MRGIKNRLEKLEKRTMPKKTVFFLVTKNETEEEAWERYLRDHPEDKDATKKVIIRFMGWEGEYAQQNKNPSEKTGKGS